MTDYQYKIYAYKDPKKMKEQDFYKELYQYPNFCASETLRLGLIKSQKKGGKSSQYGHIYAIDSFIKCLYTEWVNPVTHIKQMNSLGTYIDGIKDENVRQSFKFNKGEILKAIRFLIELEISPVDIKSDDILMNGLTEVYKEAIKNSEWRFFADRAPITKVLVKESLAKILQLEKETQKEKSNINEANIEKSSLEKIVIHGLHRFTPIILRMLEDFKNLGIEVIFIINYLEEYEDIYKTWEKVYSWTNANIEVSNEDLDYRYNLGVALGDLMKGTIETYSDDKCMFKKFDNMTDFADYVSAVYKETKNSDEKNELHGVGKISNMKEQFYAARMEDINALLKQYHPDQFGDKHFLAYPIGQFILGIYNMWDNEQQKLMIDSTNFKQCLSLGFFTSKKYSSLDIFNKIEPYYSNLDLVERYSVSVLKQKISSLKEKIRHLDQGEEKRNNKNNKKNRTLYRQFSFYNITLEELDYLEQTIGVVDSIGQEIFKDSEGNINFYDHYRKLIQIIKANIDLATGTEKEKIILDDLEKKFEKLDKIKMEGSIDDIKDSFHFYLKKIEDDASEDNQASWIVRNLEHLDGGVLMEDKTNKKYHLCIIGDLDMNQPINELLPWPLDLTRLKNMKLDNNKYEIVIKSLEERPNFLRYCLFYGTFFLESELNVSYIKNYPEEKNNPYYMFGMLGIDFKQTLNQISDTNSVPKEIEPNMMKELDYRFSYNQDISDDQVRNFIFCQYKYFLEDIIDGETIFYSQYMQGIYYPTVLHYVAAKNIKKLKSNVSEQELRGIVKYENNKLKVYFNLWPEYVFEDAENKVIQELIKFPEPDDAYLEIRKKLVYAQITDDEDDKNIIVDLHLKNPRQRNEAKLKMRSKLINLGELGPSQQGGKCKVCGVAEICLERYREI